MKKTGTFEIEEGKVYPSKYYDKSFERAIPCVWVSDEIYCGENHSEAISEFPTKLVYPSTGFLINGKVYTRDETDAKFEFGDSSSYLVRAVLDLEDQIEIALTGSDHQKRHLAANENLAPETQRILAEGSEEIKRVLSENISLIDELSFLKRGERMLENKPNEREVELAAQTWCKPEVEDRGMDPELAYAFTDTLRDYRYELMKTAEIFDYYEVTVKEAEDIFDRIIDWADGDDSIDGSDVDNIKDEIIELFKGREIPVEEAIEILNGVSGIIALKGMEGQAGMVTIPEVTAPDWMPSGVGGIFEDWMNTPVLPGAVPAAGGSAAVSALELSAKPALTPAFEAGAEFVSEQFPESFGEFIETTTPTSGTMPSPSSYNVP